MQVAFPYEVLFLFGKEVLLIALSEKQKRFADEYLIDCNAKQAAIRTGYAESSASSILKNQEVKDYIDEQLEKIHDKNVADAKEVMSYLTSVMRGRSQSEIVVVEGEGQGHTTARHINKTPDEKERLKAAELLGKRFGIFKENIEVKGAIPIVISGEEHLE